MLTGKFSNVETFSVNILIFPVNINMGAMKIVNNKVCP